MAVIGTLSRLLLMKQVIPPLRSLATLSQTFNVTSSTWSSSSAGCGILTRTLPCHWSLLPVRTKKRGMEYQPKFLKRKRTHGWLKRISTSSGIQVILRRMLKGRKSLST